MTEVRMHGSSGAPLLHAAAYVSLALLDLRKPSILPYLCLGLLALHTAIQDRAPINPPRSSKLVRRMRRARQRVNKRRRNRQK
jgi:hypothetical protein